MKKVAIVEDYFDSSLVALEFKLLNQVHDELASLDNFSYTQGAVHESIIVELKEI